MQAPLPHVDIILEQKLFHSQKKNNQQRNPLCAASKDYFRAECPQVDLLWVIYSSHHPTIHRKFNISDEQTEKQ